MAKNVVLVDKDDNELGLMDKLEAHKNPGTLHRAISVVLHRNKSKVREVLIQKRSKRKLLWSEYWDSTCSTHLQVNESYEKCAIRRLNEEMGINVSKEDVRLVDKLYYQSDYNEELSEHELDGILVGKYDGSYLINTNEVSEAKWVSWEWLKQDIKDNSDIYSPWLALMVPFVEKGGGD